ncbi:MAG: hypothetical protein OYL97_00040 [Candidatus Poribacteria bacterium]|nr:hypothetical protein [Candidatus Poribacteria bacterium]
MTKQILLSLLNCSWQWMLLIGLIWFVATPPFHKSRRSNTTVHLLWLLSLLSLPILFGLNQFVPAPSIGNTVPELAQARPIEVSGLVAQATDLPEISSTENYTQSENQLFIGGKSFFNWKTKTDLLLCVWAIGALAMLVRFIFGLYRIYQLRRNAVAADDSYQAICRRLARQLDINRPVTVCFSDRVSSPISFGWLSPYILIPRKLNLEQFELVAAHELAHVQRLDWLTNLFSHLVGVIFFFHPIYHFLNRELVRVRERICDDWVIRLTGARKNYAQCLLDLVRHEDRVIPLALSLNQPSQLESRIDSILKSNRRLDVQLKPRLQLMVATLLLTCLPLLAMAQLVPLKTFQVSLFAQTPRKAEKEVGKTDEKQVMQKEKAGKMDGKQYKDDSYIKVKDPILFAKSEENKIFSGPQPGERLPALMVTGIDGELEGQTYDITAEMDGKPFVLFLQDTNGVGVKGLVNVFELLLQIDAFQKRHSKATGAEKSNEGLQIGVVFLADNLDTLPEWARDMLRKEVPNEVLTGLSPDGREGPGSYGLNRNVAQTVLIAKDGKVLHNFAFTQPMLYPDPHFLGAIADAVGADALALEKWLNEATTKRSDEKKVKAVIIKENDDTSGDTHDWWLELRNLTDNEVNLKGWTLDIVTTELDTEGKLIRFTNDVKIPAGGVIIKDIDDASGDAHDWWLELRNPTDNEMNLKGLTVNLFAPKLDTEGKLIPVLFFNKDVKIPAGGVLRVPYPESLEKLGIIFQEYEQPHKEKKERGQTMEKDDAREREHTPSLEELVKPFDKDGDGKLNKEEGMAMRRALVNRESPNRYRRENVEVKNPAGFEKVRGATLFSGPQSGENLPPLMAKGINGETKGKTFDVIAKADGQLLVLFLQDESGLGLRGLLGISRLLAQIAEKSEQAMHINAVFLGDTPDTVENQASKLVSHVPSGVLLGVSQDGREGPGSYGLNRSVAQTVIIAKDGKVLYNFAFTQPMLRPDPYLLGAVGEAIGVKPKTLEKWLNVGDLTIAIKNPTEGEKTGKMRLNGNIVQFDELGSRLLNLPEEQKSMLTIQSGRDVPHEQIVKVMDMAKKAGIDQIGFAIDSTEGDRMQRAFVGQLREMVEKGEITGEEARELYEEAFPRSKED